MRKYILLIVLFIPSSSGRLELLRKELTEWDKMYQRIVMVESEGDRLAYNKSGAAGEIQIKPIYVKDCNRILGYEKYTLEDRYSREKSREMFEIIQSKYNPERDIDKAILIHVSGYEGYKKSPQWWYLDRVKNNSFK